MHKNNDKKKKILSAAIKVLTFKGYYNSTIDDIVKESSVSKGAIYHYYKSKKEVYLDVIAMWEQEYQEMISPALEEESSTESLKLLFSIFSKQLEKDPSLFYCLSSFWSISRLDKDFKKSVQKVYNRFQKFVEIIIQKGIDNGEFHRIDAKIAALSLIINIEGIFWFSLFESKHVKSSAYIDQISNYILENFKQK